jgi:hypothetical protein
MGGAVRSLGIPFQTALGEVGRYRFAFFDRVVEKFKNRPKRINAASAPLCGVDAPAPAFRSMQQDLATARRRP